ncbi:HlyD family type I secretion periplasmic adaptor subunit [Niveispirillum sp.]|uniref:HlyD family type I secretion periplasmic adaptor subunit n=1 Tax=Niveispirillum sp. TaxID=1917217 RepID=UPI001B4FD380|nr:HlyD family type I secretion periplasmic adaptor subunit [Niveispirillum sp.]MBP7336874.1 HlyD family type I secretion periplasmic adaptor subunit [Niveispirillum sp.]
MRVNDLPVVVALSAFRNRNPLLWIEVGCVLAFILWAALFELDVASYAEGHVIPAGQTKRVQHLEGGIISDIKVSEGQRVAQGDVIAEMESVLSGADLSELRTREATLEGRLLRITATLEGRPTLEIPAALEQAHADVVADVRSAFTTYRERYDAEVRLYETRIGQRRAEIDEARQRLAGLQSRSIFIAEQVAISEKMLKQDLTNQYDHLQLRKEQTTTDTERDATLATLRRATTALEEATATLTAFRARETETLRKELLEVNTELNSVKERLKKPTDSYGRSVIRAPAAGNVMTLYVKNKGAVVSPGGVIATIIPDGETLLIEARLPIADVGFVKIDAPARLSLTGASSGFSNMDAHVVHISPDAAVDEKTGMSYYVVRLAPAEAAFMRAGERYPLKPGVKVMATILTGSRTVLATLTDRFFDSGVGPLSER